MRLYIKNKFFYPYFTQMGNHWVCRILLLVIMLQVIPMPVKADSLTLTEAFYLAEANFPLLQQKDYNNALAAVNLDKFDINYLPTVTLNGQASYQSEVVSLPFSLPNMESLQLPKERFQFTMDVNQTLYDGGSTQALKQLEKDQNLVNNQQVQVDVHQLKQNVSSVYFATLLSGQQLEILDQNLELLQAKQETLQAAVAGGIALESELLKLEAEVLKLQQQMAQVQLNRQSSLQVLEILIGQPVGDEVVLAMPYPDINRESAAIRPELMLLDLQQQAINSKNLLTSSQYAPKVSAFVQGGVGYPNPLNFFDDELSPFYLVGVRAQWNLWSWNKKEKEVQVNQIQAQQIANRKENLERNIHIALQKQNSEMNKLQELLARDEAIIEKYEKIRKLASVQLDKGVITSSEYLEQVTNETQARLNQQLHKIQLEQAKINYQLEQGNL